MLACVPGIALHVAAPAAALSDQMTSAAAALLWIICSCRLHSFPDAQSMQVLDERLAYAVEHCTTYDNLPNAGRFSRTHSKDDEVVPHRAPQTCTSVMLLWHSLAGLRTCSCPSLHGHQHGKPSTGCSCPQTLYCQGCSCHAAPHQAAPDTARSSQVAHVPCTS